MNTDRFNNLRKRLLTPGRSLLLPMLILAAGIHVALLAMPLPSTEAIKEAEDKKNPITVNQIPTAQPDKATSSPPGTVDVPDLATNPPSASATAADEGATAGDPAVDTGAAESASSRGTTAEPTASSATTAATKPTTSNAATATNTASSSDSTTGATGAIESENAADSEVMQNTTPEATASAVATAPTAANLAASAFADFPHFQPSEADCYGLGFGENCRIVEGQDLPQVAEFFKRELAAKEFTTTVVADTADRKVFKVAKGDQTMFLNIWKGKNNISYLLAKVILKQSPEDIKVETKP